jgi:hypothetical protein
VYFTKAVTAVANILQRLVVVSGPEEWDLTVGALFAKHVKSGVGALVQCSHPVFRSDTATSRPVRVARDVASCEHILIVCSQKGITNDTSVTIHLDTGILQEFRRGTDAATYDHKVSLNGGTIGQLHRLYIALGVSIDLLHVSISVNFDVVFLMFF